MIKVVMRGSSDEEIKIYGQPDAFILRQARECTAVAEVCGKADTSDATFYNQRKRFGGIMPREVHQFRQLEDENSRLKKVVAGLTLGKAMLQDAIKRKL